MALVSPVRTPVEGPSLLTECGLMVPALEMEFAAHFARADGEPAAEAAVTAVTRVIDAPGSFLEPIREAGRAVTRELLKRTTAGLCRVVLSADESGITLAATDDTMIALDAAPHAGIRKQPLLAVIDDLRVHHGPDGHRWVVWQGAWAAGTGSNGQDR
ncbi:hypothetical protein ACFS5L_04555 [Streptomyces phyllanthi]|uniref:Uncharacterized protein n=1 Tax=Streptomyces phyllanthi TaxID=1803180 RepID=A0A5N8WC02_9ACTN|nr:hypothetical protein [Streptomyces phyllanthi]MPY44326.1 hypothetical protein [Streptomyces phyllanthi]